MPSDARRAQGERALARETLARLPTAAAVVAIALTIALIASEPSSIPLRGWVIALNLALICGSAVLCLAARAGWIREEHAAPAALAAWLAAPATSLASMSTSDDPRMSLVLVIELVAAPSVILPRRWLIAGVGAAVAGWTALALRDGGHLFRAHAVFMAGTIVMVTVGHVIHTRAVIRAEHARADTEEANAKLRGELDERLRAEAERERYREQLVAAQRLEAIGTLAGGLSHDMNNILAGILGAADALRSAPPADVPDLARKIADEATRGADLTRSLLAFSRRGRYQHKAVPIAAAVDDVVAVLRRTASKRVALAVHHERRDLVVDGDPAQLPQVILNLVANAVQAIHDPGDHPGPDAPAEAPRAGRAGEVSIVTSLHTGEGGAHHVVIEVGDTGAGMDDETREHIFEPFFTTKATGRGLGLAMVWGTIEAHHGTIDVDTAPGRGTTMRVRLPARIDPSYAPAPAPVLDTSLDPAPAGSQLHVLLVDDEPLVRSMFERALKRAGMRVTGAAHGLDALERFADASPPIDAVVLDMAMPVMGGAECFRRLRERQPHLPIVIASGYTGDAEIRTLVATGAATFLEKPFRMEALVSALQGLIV